MLRSRNYFTRTDYALQPLLDSAPRSHIQEQNSPVQGRQPLLEIEPNITPQSHVDQWNHYAGPRQPKVGTKRMHIDDSEQSRLYTRAKRRPKAVTSKKSLMKDTSQVSL